MSEWKYEDLDDEQKVFVRELNDFMKINNFVERRSKIYDKGSEMYEFIIQNTKLKRLYGAFYLAYGFINSKREVFIRISSHTKRILIIVIQLDEYEKWR